MTKSSETGTGFAEQGRDRVGEKLRSDGFLIGLVDADVIQQLRTARCGRTDATFVEQAARAYSS